MSEEVAAQRSEQTVPEQRQGGALEWLWRGQALRRVRAFRSELPVDARLALERALSACELADRAYDPVDALRSGSSLPSAVSLYREAVYWALQAHSPALAPDTLSGLFASVSQARLEELAGGSDTLDAVRRALVERSFVQTAALPVELVRADADAARAFVHRVLDARLEPESRAAKLLLQRGLRLFGIAVALAVLVGCAAWGWAYGHRTPDLAAGKPWRASSSPDKCHPAEHRCAGAHTDMFFTTSEEVDPWVEIDLGKPTPLNLVAVKNRDDCCPDRATPLIVEVGNDQKTWREVSRRTDTFTFWQTRFARQTARYVRLRVPRRTIFHLSKIEVHDAG